MRTEGNNISNLINHLDAKEAKWFAVQTKFRAEKYVAEHLKRKGISAYVPLLKKTKRYTRKVKNYELPLLNCYVFVHITKEQFITVLETEYVLKFIKQRKNLISIPSAEIMLLRKIVGEIENLNVGPIQYTEGQTVEIIAGNLTGLSGVLIKKKSKRLFVIGLDHIGIQLEIEVEKSLVQPKGIRASMV